MRQEMAVLLLLCISPLAAWANDPSPGTHSSDPYEGGWIALNGTNQIKIPNLSAPQEANWSYPFDHVTTYAENQSIKGIFWGSSDQAYTKVKVVVSRFNLSAFLGAFQVIEGKVKADGTSSSVELNRSGDASFALNGLSSGIYTIFIMDENNSVVLSALPLLISKAELTLQMPDNIKAGDFMQLRVNISTLNNQSISQSNNSSRIFAAIMISRKDYENASLKLDTNGTKESLKSTLTLGDKSMQIQLSNISSEQLMPLLYLLPENSAIGIQESKESWADILLITDENWDKGSYILTYAVYSPGKGLLGLNQETVEVV